MMPFLKMVIVRSYFKLPEGIPPVVNGGVLLLLVILPYDMFFLFRDFKWQPQHRSRLWFGLHLKNCHSNFGLFWNYTYKPCIFSKFYRGSVIINIRPLKGQQPAAQGSCWLPATRLRVEDPEVPYWQQWKERKKPIPRRLGELVRVFFSEKNIPCFHSSSGDKYKIYLGKL